jgi:hypothetical protein
MKMSRTEIGAIVIAALIAIAGIAYFEVYDKPSKGYFAEQLTIEIGRGASNETASYVPGNFTVAQGEHVSLAVENYDNSTHGLAIPGFDVNTGGIAPNGTMVISFIPNALGNFTFSEPSSDCGGGTCDAGQNLAGWFVVTN